jgi:hypothetical protein
MRELYTRGIAVQGGPEPCVGVREGVGEALVGVVRAGLLSRVITNRVRGADVLPFGGRQYRHRRYRELVRDPARSENLGTHVVSMRENREVLRSPVRRSGGSRGER